MKTNLWQLLSDHKIVIPMLQRDYAQGRETPAITSVRNNFLTALYSALQENGAPLELDFIYGYTRENRQLFIPLDGQQRLTTLFLLHWYFALKEDKMPIATDRLKKFTWQTRDSSRKFCEALISFTPNLQAGKLKEIIMDQSWFFPSWKKDPTISSMLIMLNEIQTRFADITDAWPLLTSADARISFYILPMDTLKLQDELYIKMNARGKELTNFEIFKSEISALLTPDHAEFFNNAIDQQWSDLIWKLYEKENDVDIARKTDSGFLRFFNFITDILCYLNTGKQSDENSYKTVYTDINNVSYLFNTLNNLTTTYIDDKEIFHKIFYINDNAYSGDNVRLFFQGGSIDLFKACTARYDTAPNNNSFSIGEQLMLFAFLEHLQYGTVDFKLRIRILRNLIANSEGLLNDKMPILLKTVSTLIQEGRIDNGSPFNNNQIKEEILKQEIIIANPDLKQAIHELEDHELLRGCLAIFDLNTDLPAISSAFKRLFQRESKEIISLVLLSFGDYSQTYYHLRRLGNHNSSVWQELLTPSIHRKNFYDTKKVLYDLLNYMIQYPYKEPGDILKEKKSAYTNKPKDWIYYCLHYDSFHKWGDTNTEGYWYWEKDDRSRPYECIMMFRKQFNGRHWSPFLLTLKHIDELSQFLELDVFNHPLILNIGDQTVRIKNLNNGFSFISDNEHSNPLMEKIRNTGQLDSEDVLMVQQTMEGLDKEDRILQVTNFIKSIIQLQ